jgi:hypothetical protein
MTLNDIEGLIDLCRRKGVVRAKWGDIDLELVFPEPKQHEAAKADPNATKIGPDGLTKAEAEELYFSASRE